MTAHPMDPIRSEKGVALIVVLLLLAVMAGLTTGLTLNGQTEIAMSTNEGFYAGARAAAEAGMNRAIQQITNPANNTINLLTTPSIPAIGNGPFNLTPEYSYSFVIVDDDDPSLYTDPLDADQLARMGENGDPAVNLNTRMILRCIGTGPRGTTVTLSRILSSTAIPDLPTINNVVTNPAILVNGDLSIDGNTKVLGTQGNVHANGDITGGGSVDISGDLTATGEVPDGITPGGLKAGGMPPITVPEIKASDFRNLADWILPATGGLAIRASDNQVCGGKSLACPSVWTFDAGTSTWRASGAMPTSGTYYVEGNAEIHGTGKSSGFTQISVIAEGSLKITGNGKFKPENGVGIQFVTNGDFELGGTADADDPIDMDGQIMVREQMKIYGNSEFQGRVMVENRDSATNVYNPLDPTTFNNNRGTSTLGENTLTGNMTVTYNGGLGNITSTITIPGGATTFANNVSGWIEQ